MSVIDFFQLSETNQEQVYYLQHIDHIIKSSIIIARISDPLKLPSLPFMFRTPMSIFYSLVSHKVHSARKLTQFIAGHTSHVT